MVQKYAKSKTGWRKKPTTAIRQEKKINQVLQEAAERCGEVDPSQILRSHLDTVEEVLLARLPHHPAQVKSMVIALLEFCRFASVREPCESAAWDAAIRRLEVWKRDAALLDQHREAALQDRMGEDDYLPSKEELARLRAKVHEKLTDITKRQEVAKRTDAVQIRRLVSTAILLDNFQRSGTIKNVTIQQYEDIKEGIMRVKEHKHDLIWLGKSCRGRCGQLPGVLRPACQAAAGEGELGQPGAVPLVGPMGRRRRSVHTAGRETDHPHSAPEGGLDGSVLDSLRGGSAPRGESYDA